MIFDFIWHLRGSVSLGAATTGEVALGRVERLLEEQRKPVVERGPNNIVFRAPMWSDLFGPNWLAMLIYDHGRFWIERGRVCYELRSLHGFIFCLSFAAIISLFGLVEGPASALKFAVFGFSWLYGMNVALALIRVPAAIRVAVEGP